LADRVGTYVIQLVVNDGILSSNPANVTITTNDVAPVANAGSNQSNVAVGSVVQLDGTGSIDVNGHALTYSWSLLTVPQLSTATLSSTTAARPSFTADKAGTYVAQLIVNDGFLNSLPSTVTISTTSGPPVANAGQNQQVNVGTIVLLNGSASTD